MAEKTTLVTQNFLKAIKINKWKVKEGSSVSVGRVILLYNLDDGDKCENLKLKCSQAGIVLKLFAQEGDSIRPGESLLELQACIHSTVMRDMCAECGADLRRDNTETPASVPMLHAVPDLKVSHELAQKLGKADSDRLLSDRKLVLLVDLDQTLIHTTNDNIPANLKDVYHFQLYGPNSPWYHTRLRPFTRKFLANMLPFFELHICTFGARNYAHMIAKLLDPDSSYFAYRILSRDECFDSTSKKANLKALFPCGDNMVCIIDDREDVWSHATNLIHVKPYHFFQHTGDINAPLELRKNDDDTEKGVDLSNLGKAKPKEVVAENSKEALDNCETKDEEMETVSEGTKKEDDTIKTEKADENTVTENAVEKPTEENVGNEIAREKPANNEAECKPANDNVEEKPASENVEEEATVEDKTANGGKQTEQNDKAISVSQDDEKKESDAEVTVKITPAEDMIEVEDPDDYLLYLEDILKTVHKTFYDSYDKMESGEVPDLKKVIPKVRSKVLLGTKLCFSGLVPTQNKLEHSKAYQVAKSLGAEITQSLEEDTTHLVAVRPGTAKVNAGRRRKSLKIVTPDWLWACAEWWLRVEEDLYPLNHKGSKNRHPPPHCSSPEHPTRFFDSTEMPAARKRTPSGRFMDTINPLMTFSRADIADMDKEVEDIFNESESDEELEKRQREENEFVEEDEEEEDEEDVEEKRLRKRVIRKESSSSSSSSNESLTGEHPKGWKRRKDAIAKLEEEEEEFPTNTEDDTMEEFPAAKFRRGEPLSSDLDIGQESNSEGSAEPLDEIDDGDWNMMGAALEREFLANN